MGGTNNIISSKKCDELNLSQIENHQDNTGHGNSASGEGEGTERMLSPVEKKPQDYPTRCSPVELSRKPRENHQTEAGRGQAGNSPRPTTDSRIPPSV